MLFQIRTEEEFVIYFKKVSEDYNPVDYSSFLLRISVCILIDSL